MEKKVFVGILAFFMPPLAFLYLSRGSIALVYLAALIFSMLGDYLLNLYYGISGLGLTLAVVAVFHSLKLVKNTNDNERKRFFNYWWGALTIPIVIVIAIFTVRSFLCEPFRIPSESMSPNLNPGNHVLISKFGYGTYGTWGFNFINLNRPGSKPNPGEIFVLYPPHESRVFVERIIGVPGDEVLLFESTLSINGKVVSEILDFTTSKETVGENTFIVKYLNEPFRFKNHRITVPDGHYFVMGDNRNNSLDSRFWGVVPEANIVGKVVLQW
ncbi:signal peptidase I [Teredinibacter sp. KSP-S5-2]|uniref:signal peptidase I n=1 Tax=Teredinibacter sp. KSP-S5-2 TaxID=3034506 RepID=UPI0029345F0C|nr:signal peptidase I [Teredinibacter sp. KSP-S5-2]WNO11659.1 signal peptidase I [Teredinibacter sp. KSP-S5-2]